MVTSENEGGRIKIQEIDVAHDRDSFFRHTIRHISGTLEDVIGIEEASGFISIVGAALGSHIKNTYCEALNTDSLDRSSVIEVLIDLKRRIGGDFYLAEASKDKIVLMNRKCPFGDSVLNRPSLCMMTSNVFGRIVADSLGYARIELDKTIAKGDPGCLVVIHLSPENEPLHAENVREYYASSD
ncbi:MAG: methanogen output domain 1-containing protein [Aestuariibacter sp.]